MRVIFLALITAVLFAQDTTKEAKIPVGNGELRYLYEEGTQGSPLIVALPGDVDEVQFQKAFAQWKTIAASRGWSCVMPFMAGVADQAVKALELVLTDAKKRLPGFDQTRVYLIGQGGSVPEIFYMLSREPDLWAAGLAIQGSPAPAINSFRLYAGNTKNVPLLWIAGPWEFEMYRPKLAAAGYNVEVKQEAKMGEALDWLANHQRTQFPPAVDCETGTAAFARCYWIDMTKFDPKAKNDALSSSRVPAGSGAWLEAGPFGFDPQAEGPGVMVSFLPSGYQGPLKLNDRILSIGGKDIQNSRDYAQHMDEMKEAKAVALVVQRGSERIRVETKVLLPKRDETITARVQGEYLPDQKELMIISRALTEMRVRVPAQWIPVTVSWNGLNVLKADSAGCWTLTLAKDKPESSPCQ